MKEGGNLPRYNRITGRGSYSLSFAIDGEISPDGSVPPHLYRFARQQVLDGRRVMAAVDPTANSVVEPVALALVNAMAGAGK